MVMGECDDLMLAHRQRMCRDPFGAERIASEGPWSRPQSFLPAQCQGTEERLPFQQM